MQFSFCLIRTSGLRLLLTALQSQGRYSEKGWVAPRHSSMGKRPVGLAANYPPSDGLDQQHPADEYRVS